jgi:hypothetical protein
LLVVVLVGWLDREQRDVIAFLREENRVLKMQLHGRRLRLSDDERRRLAVIGRRLGRHTLTTVTRTDSGPAMWLMAEKTAAPLP